MVTFRLSTSLFNFADPEEVKVGHGGASEPWKCLFQILRSTDVGEIIGCLHFYQLSSIDF